MEILLDGSPAFFSNSSRVMPGLISAASGSFTGSATFSCDVSDAGTAVVGSPVLAAPAKVLFTAPNALPTDLPTLLAPPEAPAAPAVVNARSTRTCADIPTDIMIP